MGNDGCEDHAPRRQDEHIGAQLIATARPYGLLALSIVGFFLLFFPYRSLGAGVFDPALRWRTMETRHFYIHYHQGLEGTAVETAREAERAYAELTGRLAQLPRAKVHIVVAGTSDFANGAARIFPYPQIMIFAASPRADSSLDNYDLWIRTLITHEYSHLLVMDMARGVPAALRRIFGYSVAMNAFVPGWWREGYAVFEESARTTAGRGRSAYLDMVLRAAVLDGRFPSIDRAGDGMIKWPGGETPYLFGGAFYSYLAQKYGEEKLTEFLHRYSGQLIPFRMNSAAKKVFGKDFIALWEEWEKSLEKKYRAQSAAIQAEGVEAGKALTDRGFGIGKPVWSPGSDRIFFYEASPHSGGSVKSISPQGKGEKEIFAADLFGSFSLDSAGKQLVYARLVSLKGKPSRRFYLYTDLYVYDVSKKKSRRLTRGERASDPSFSPDGKFVVYVSTTFSGMALKTVEVKSGAVTEILKPRVDVVMDTPRFSPDGSSVVFSARTRGRGRDIFLLKSGEKIPERLTNHPARDLDPAWSHDGRYVLFTSERDGVPNIYAIDVESRALYKVTNVLGGAFEPAASPDGKWIAYSGYSSRGYDLWAVPSDRSAWKPLGKETPIELSTAIAPAPEVEIKSRPYRPWSSLLPRYLLPTFWYDGVDFLVGLQTGGIDPVGYHSWRAGASWGSGSEFLNWEASYSLNRFAPSVGGSASQYAVSYGEILLALEDLDHDGVFSIPAELVLLNKDYYEMRTQGMFWMAETFGFMERPLRISLAFKWQDRDNWTDIPAMTFDSMLPGMGTFSGIELSMTYDATTAYSYSISPEKGFNLRVGFDWLDEALGSDYNQRIFTGDVRVFVPNPIFRHHVLAMRAAGGVMEGDKLFQGTFRVGGAMGESILSAPPKDFFSLRGYKVADFVGDKAAVFSGEYRFPIFYPERGLGKMFPLFVQKVHGAVFADYGGAFDRKRNYPLSINGRPLIDKATGKQAVLEFEKQEDWNLGVGAELKLTGFVGWGLHDQPLTGRVGYAKDITGNGLGNTIYLELGTSF